jgi:hypothetical protein
MNININIKPKYNIGATVYIADHYYDFYAQQKPYTIRDIYININRDRISIMYQVEQKDIICKVPEEWVFTTYAECTKWCSKHN